MNLKNVSLVTVALLVIFSLTLFSQDSKTQREKSRPTVALSTFSLYDITKHVAGDTVDTFMIIPFGVDAHSYEPTPRDVAKIYKSDLVVYSGAGLEPWIDGFVFQNRSVDMSLHVNLKSVGSDEHDEHDSHDTHGDEDDHKSCGGHLQDPHYWLDLHNMVKATEYITKELIALFPEHQELYRTNRDAYIAMLQTLDSDYKQTLSKCARTTIVVNHNAFSYLSSSYGFDVEALSGLSPEAEPSAKVMAELIEHVKEHKLKTIFFESFVSDKAIKAIADETGVGVDVLQPLGNITADEAEAKSSYEDIMRRNLKKIAQAMECVNEL